MATLPVRYKPVSEKDNNLAVLANTNAPISLRSPSGQVLSTGRNYGPSNGFGGTYRFDRPGAAFPSGTDLWIGDTRLDVPNTGGSYHSLPHVSGARDIFNTAGGGAAGQGAGMIDLSAFSRQLGLPGGMPSGFTAIPGQEAAFRDHTMDLFNKWSDLYDPALEQYLKGVDQSRLSYLQAPGTADAAMQAGAFAPGDAASGQLLTGALGHGAGLGAAQATNAAGAYSQDVMGRIGRQLDALEIGKGMQQGVNDGLSGLAKIATSGAMSLGDTELGAMLQKMSGDTNLQIRGIENAANRKVNRYQDQMNYYDFLSPAIDRGIGKGIDWVMDRF